MQKMGTTQGSVANYFKLITSIDKTGASMYGLWKVVEQDMLTNQYL